MTKWVVFDYDGTLTTHRSGWTVLHSIFGTEHVQSERLKAYRNGELSFEEWAELDVQNWIERGATRTDIEQAANAIKISTGTERVLNELGEIGYRFGVLSGGLIDLTMKIRQFDPDFIRANPLVFDEGGNLKGVEKQVGPSEKGRVLKREGARRGFDVSDVTFVGDSRSDLEAFQIANRAILFDPPPNLDEEVYEVADNIIDHHDLAKLLAHL